MGVVKQWQDQSGNAAHANQTTVSKRPGYVTSTLNGKPVLRLDGVDDNFTLATTPSMSAGYTVIWVGNAAGTSHHNNVAANSSTSSVGPRYFSSGNAIDYRGTASTLETFSYCSGSA